ncbi:MAG: hypothetical protein EP335_01555 [Alphaproteobacteria bacterium]|nr:MAG: hypothetical protein EP335_01555 [Alphaproteobacteria bacterium]
MQLCLLTRERLPSGAAGVPFEALWARLHREHKALTFQILPHAFRAEADICLPDCRHLRGRFGAVSVLPHAHDLIGELATTLRALGPALACIADDALAPLAVGLRQQCPELRLVMLAPAAAASANWPVFGDLFEAVLSWENCADAIADQLAGMLPPAAQPARPMVEPLAVGALFNAMTRFFTGHFLCWQPETGGRFDASLFHDGNPVDCNIALDVHGAGPFAVLDVKAVLPPALVPEAVLLRLEKAGPAGRETLFEGPLATACPRESCGMLAVDERVSERRLIWWQAPAGMTQGSAARSAVTIKAEPLPPVSDGPLHVAAHGHDCWFQERVLLQNGARGDDLSVWRDRHAGEVAWLIGNGPSVRHEDLEKLQGRLTIGFNRLHLAYDRIQFRPSYLVSADRQMLDDFGTEILTHAASPVFFARNSRPDIAGDFTWLRQVGCFPTVFSLDAEQYVTAGGSSVYVAMQLAYLMGVRKFCFYGADFRFSFERDAATTDHERSAVGDGNHFIPGYRGGRPWSPPEFRAITQSFLTADLLLRAEGGFVKNVTRGGRLEIFERMDFDAALAADKEGRL